MRYYRIDSVLAHRTVLHVRLQGRKGGSYGQPYTNKNHITKTKEPEIPTGEKEPEPVLNNVDKISSQNSYISNKTRLITAPTPSSPPTVSFKSQNYKKVQVILIYKVRTTCTFFIGSQANIRVNIIP